MDAQVTVVAFGDSTTAPRKNVVTYADLLQAHWQARRPDVRVVNAGLGADHTNGALARMERDVLAHAPQIVIIRFGINDAAVDVWKDPPATTSRVPFATFCDNLRVIVTRVRERGAIPVLCTPNPMAWNEISARYKHAPYLPDDPEGFNVPMMPYVAAIREIAAEMAVPLVDLDVAFRQHESESVPPWDALLLDGQHPNDAGHALAAAQLIPVLEELLQKIP